MRLLRGPPTCNNGSKDNQQRDISAPTFLFIPQSVIQPSNIYAKLCAPIMCVLVNKATAHVGTPVGVLVFEGRTVG
jgi:hypothetical protein